MTWCYRFIGKLPPEADTGQIQALLGLGSLLTWLDPTGQSLPHKDPRFSVPSSCSAFCGIWTPWPLSMPLFQAQGLQSSLVFSASYPNLWHATVLLFARYLCYYSHATLQALAPTSALNWVPCCTMVASNLPFTATLGLWFKHKPKLWVSTSKHKVCQTQAPPSGLSLTPR